MVAGVLVAAMSTSAAGQFAPPLDPVARIGALDGADHETFGFIADVAVDAHGNILVLDRSTFDIRWFDSTGKYRGRGGRKGAGPGEFVGPSSLAIGTGNVIYEPFPQVVKYRLR